MTTVSHKRVRAEKFGRCSMRISEQAYSLDHPGETGGREWRAPFRSKRERRFWLLFALEPPKGS
jgi:hypothetical protein